MATPYIPVFDGAAIGAGGSTSFDYTAQGTFGTLCVLNLGDGDIAFALGSIPANTTPGSGKCVLTAGISMNMGLISLSQTIGVRADGTGSSVQIMLQLEQTDGGGAQ